MGTQDAQEAAWGQDRTNKVSGNVRLVCGHKELKVKVFSTNRLCFPHKPFCIVVVAIGNGCRVERTPAFILSGAFCLSDVSFDLLWVDFFK